MHHDQTVSKTDRIFHVMCYHHGCQVIFADDLVGECKYFCGSLWIKSGCMLIKEQKFRLFKGSHQKCDCLTLSAGEETNLTA